MLSCAYISSLKPTSIISSCRTMLCYSPSVSGMCRMQKVNTQWGQCVHLSASFTTESTELILIKLSTEVITGLCPLHKENTNWRYLVSISAFFITENTEMILMKLSSEVYIKS